MDVCEHITHLDHVSGVMMQCVHCTVIGTCDFDSGFIRLHFTDAGELLDGVALVDKPSDELTFFDAFAGLSESAVGFRGSGLNFLSFEWWWRLA